MEVLRLGNDELQLEVLPGLGARWHRLTAFGQEVLRSPADPRAHAADPFFWGAYVMAPWCNRTPAGPMHWGGRPIDLPSNFPDGTAIHGQVYDRAWQVVGEASLAVEAGGDGWPWRYAAAQHIWLEGGTLRVEVTLENRDDGPMPAGIGMHPWFARPLRVALDAGAVYPSNVSSPVTPEPVVGRLDLRRLASPPHGLDATWSLFAEPAGRLAWPSGLSAQLSLGEEASHVALASPTDPDAIAIEPQSHAPDGMRRLANGEPGGLMILAPGARLEVSYALRFRRH